MNSTARISFRNILRDFIYRVFASLNSKFFIWFFFTSIIPAVIIGYLIYTVSVSSINQETLTKVESVSSLTEYSLTSAIRSQLDQMTLLARDSNIRESPKSVLGSFAFKAGDKSVFSVYDTEGNLLASSSETQTDKISLGTDITKSLEERKYYISDIYRLPQSEQYFYDLFIPINDAGGNIQSVLVGNIDLDKLIKVLSKSARSVGKSGDVYLINSQNYISSPAIGIDSSQILNVKYNSAEINSCINGDEFTGKTINYAKNPVFISTKTKSINTDLGVKWCLVTSVSEKEALSSVLLLKNYIVLAIIPLIAVIYIISRISSENLSDFIKNPIEKISYSLGTASEQLAASSQQSSAASQQNASVAQQLAAGATQQSKQAEEVSTSVTMLASALQQMSKASQEVSESASISTKTIKETGITSQEAKKRLEKISTAIGNTAEIINKTAERSKSIGKIIGSITEVSEQTNMLALNAAIEAARAGDAGRGFAVVADEVRKLAEESKKSAQEISILIGDVLQSIHETVVRTDDTTRTVNESSEIIESSLSRLEDISESSEDVYRKIQDISAAIQQQASAIQQISKNMESIAKVAEQNSEGSQQLSSSTQQQSAINQQVAQAAQQLQQTAMQLQDLVGKSKTYYSSNSGINNGNK